MHVSDNDVHIHKHCHVLCVFISMVKNPKAYYISFLSSAQWLTALKKKTSQKAQYSFLDEPVSMIIVAPSDIN